MTFELKPTQPEETAALQKLAEGTAVFYPHEIETLGEVLADYAKEGDAYGHVARTLWDVATPVGFFYLAPVAMTLGTWELWWLAVHKGRQGEGIGALLMREVEAIMASQGGRILIIETSSTPIYKATQGFYEKQGYRLVAEVPDFYRDGDGKLIYSKKFTSG